MKKYYFLLLTMALFSCNGNLGNQDSAKGSSSNFKQKAKLIPDQKISSADTFQNEKIFLPILPSAKYLDSIQRITPEDEWSEIVSDNEYYRNQTQEYLNKQGYKEIKIPLKRFWYFKLKNGKLQTIDTIDLANRWGSLIYNGKDSAIVFEGTIPEEELKNKL
ncbi:hypothetical protein GS399_15650 [Pedobacter sp. HMF7647]|uniref:Lipoprotein n=1 Tax=Hufsiella arboris TaxID=2695275 RepID=A0A7K1YEF0_9SPHI|nr:hypothetical protein [Hufsiella arboris]MXV52409.1 hypothetical protein [Hufsiella arboris]